MGSGRKEDWGRQRSLTCDSPQRMAALGRGCTTSMQGPGGWQTERSLWRGEPGSEAEGNSSRLGVGKTAPLGAQIIGDLEKMEQTAGGLSAWCWLPAVCPAGIKWERREGGAHFSVSPHPTPTHGLEVARSQGCPRCLHPALPATGVITQEQQRVALKTKRRQLEKEAIKTIAAATWKRSCERRRVS